MPELELLVLILCTILPAILIALGIPLLRGWVPPNQTYGFRSPQTLRDAQVWYAANRVCGFWLILTGIVSAGVAAGMFAAGIAYPYGLFATLVVLLLGTIVMLTRSDAASRRPAGDAKQERLQFRLLSLFILTATIAIACAIARLPAPWVLKAGVLWAYGICAIGLLVRNGDHKTTKAG